jgi:2-dehydropantoate 2-reductase
VEAFHEVEAVARPRGIRLALDVVDRTLRMVDGLDVQVITSMQRDVPAGKPFELEAFSGPLVREGRELGMATPGNAAI